MTDENTKPETEVEEIDVDEEIRKSKFEKISKIEPSLYWEWRATIEELNTAKERERVKMLEAKIIQQEIEIKKLQLREYNSKIQSASDTRKSCEKESKRIKEKIEDEVGFSLENCVIDDITFEVRKISE